MLETQKLRKWMPLVLSAGVTPVYAFVGFVVALLGHGNPFGIALFFPFAFIYMVIFSAGYPDAVTFTIATLHLPVYGLILSLVHNRRTTAALVVLVHFVVGLSAYGATLLGLL
jgi:hypothetical protein